MKNESLTIISADQQSKHYWKELWNFKELFLLLAWRDLLVRYKQTLLGVAWAVLRPLVTVLVFTVVFGKLANLPSGETPYAIFVFAAMLPWQFFATSLTEAGNSLVANSSIISKIYFPRILIPVSSMAVCFLDTMIAGIIFMCLMLWYGHIPSWKILYLPVFSVWLLLITFAVSLWVATANVTYRDFRYLIPFLSQVGMYISPVGFGSNIIPEKWLWLYYLNPIAGIIDGFRWSIFDGENPLRLMEMIPSFLLTIIFLVFSLSYFRKKEDIFADGI